MLVALDPGSLLPFFSQPMCFLDGREGEECRSYIVTYIANISISIASGY